MEKKKVKKESLVFKVEEMRDEIDISISNLDKVISEHNELINLCETYGKEKFEELVKSLKEEVKRLTEKKKDLTKKSKDINVIIKQAKEDVLYDEYLTLILKTLINF